MMRADLSGRNVLRLAIATVVGVALLSFASARWAIGIDSQKVHCLPWTVYFIEKGTPPLIKGEYYGFLATGLEPVFPDDGRMLKQLAAVPGDTVDISERGIAINGQLYGPMNPAVLEKVHGTRDVHPHSYVVPAGQLLFLATGESTYDGRYWGTVAQERVIARAHPLW